MALIDNLKRAAHGPSPSEQRTTVAAKLQAAETSLADIETKRDAASLDALIDAPGAKGELARLNAASKEAREQIEVLQAAHRAAIAREQEANRNIRRDAIKHAFSRTKAHLKARTEAAQEYATAIEAAAKAYRKIHESDDKAREHIQIANIGEYPPGAFSGNAFASLAAAEAWRYVPLTKQGEPITYLGIPGAAFAKLEYQHWPDGAPALAQQLEEDANSTLAALASKVPE